ncbi:Mitochondrial carrier protein domain-containing protein [Paramicrosporidium saccamoebae]|uniref:Mitochondrial carrier protein domain-containing protein n=1 Tax=Paramicrosporidium saccamoebae TaxID=1246581 RepID=A0A2H9TH96_9FUNG|nr:Mitochondrial carrier protein domain-containing protein [Paramicrosporidium saccamoebae]
MPKSPDSISESRYQTLETLICGGVAGSVAKTVIAPFDRVKIHFQVQNPALSPYSGRLRGVFHALQMIYKSTGITGVYRGHSAMLLRIFPYAAINYLSYETFRRGLYEGEPVGQVAWWKRILAGSLAGSVAVSCTYPLDIIRVRLAFDLSTKKGEAGLRRYVQSFQTVASALASEGRKLFGFPLAGFYQGFLPTLGGILPYAGVSYFSFESQKSAYRTHIARNEDADIPLALKLIMGMLSGALAQTAAYPLDVVRRRAQVLRVAPHLRKIHSGRPSALQILAAVLREHGVRGLFAGLSINYLKVAPATGVSFVIYEFMRENIFHMPRI